MKVFARLAARGKSKFLAVASPRLGMTGFRNRIVKAAHYPVFDGHDLYIENSLADNGFENNHAIGHCSGQIQ